MSDTDSNAKREGSDEDEAEAKLVQSSAFIHACFYCNTRAVVALHKEQSANFIYRAAQRSLEKMQSRAVHTKNPETLEEMRTKITHQAAVVTECRAEYMQMENDYLTAIDKMSACLVRLQKCCHTGER